jgi:hypothetical protein
MTWLIAHFVTGIEAGQAELINANITSMLNKRVA